MGRVFFLPGGDSHLVARLDLTPADGERSTVDPGNSTQTILIDSSEETERLVARIYRIEGSLLVPLWTGLAGNGGDIGQPFSVNASANVTYIVVAHATGVNATLRIAAAHPIPEDVIEGRPLALGNDGAFSYAIEGHDPLGDSHRHNMEHGSEGRATAGARVGGFRLSTEHAANGTSLHTTGLWWSSGLRTADLRLERTLDGRSETEDVHVAPDPTAGRLAIERDALVAQGARDALVVTNEASVGSFLFLFSTTTPWDPASLGLRLAEGG